MVILLVIVAALAALAALFNLNQATLGVGLLAYACFFAILARLAQAGVQHAELRRIIRDGRGAP